MALSYTEKLALRQEMADNGNRPGRAATTLRLDFDDVMAFCADDNTARGVYSYLPKDAEFGKNHVICTKSITDPWPRSAIIDQARKDYDRGNIEMCSHREGDILYLVVQRRRFRDLKRTPYFSRASV
ncbi:hypothetical protein [Telmatospirillum sp.]|uniref:hypothetical protein n=1 Tax=Telmatospirillum sp. TaxID=2079197 RepID=UPI00284B4345|nr:hypothetical protein [Telmatospirillum sp.]MDR3436467.1 hypothetical protein [Telmatospirillum sp.]